MQRQRLPSGVVCVAKSFGEASLSHIYGLVLLLSNFLSRPRQESDFLPWVIIESLAVSKNVGAFRIGIGVVG